MNSVAPPTNFSRSGPYFAALFGVALVAFWPSYLSQRPSASSAYTHFHALTATLWMLMLVAQPLAIRTRRLPLHRLLGRVSYVLAPLVLLSMVLLAHSRIQNRSGDAYAIQAYVLYLQTSLTVLFGAAYALAIYKRRIVALHARFMIGTGLTLIDPVVVRLMLWVDPSPDWNYQWLTFGLTDLVLVALIVAERGSRRGRGVFPAMLAVFMLVQAPAVLGLTEGRWWQAFAKWFATLSIT